MGMPDDAIERLTAKLAAAEAENNRLRELIRSAIVFRWSPTELQELLADVMSSNDQTMGKQG